MAKVEILAFATGLPRTDLAGHRPGTAAAAQAALSLLFPGRIGAPLPAADLLTAGFPEYGRVYAATFGPATVICGQDLVELVDLAAAVAPLSNGRNVFRLQINSRIDSVALEILAPDGNPVREVMLVGEEGVIFDIGPHLDFESRFWAGDSDAHGSFRGINGAEMPFEANDFGEAALRSLFGFVIDADPERGDLDPGAIRLHGFVIAADSADPSDMASVRSGGPAPALPTDILVGSGAGPGGARPHPGAAGTPDAEPGGEPAEPGQTWWQRLKRRLFS